MKQQADGSVDPAISTLDRELDLVRGAITMVAAGRAPRVVLAGLRFGEQLVAPAQEMAAKAGVRIIPLWRTDESGADLAVERGRDG
jgi:hypothetical protein